MHKLLIAPMELSQAFAQAVSKGLMDPVQYFRIVMEILTRGPCDLLLFGAGVDTELYLRANPHGTTLVIEDHPGWADQAHQASRCELLQVRYTSQLSAGWSKDCRLPDGLNEAILRSG